MKKILFILVLLGLGYIGYSQGKPPLAKGENQLNFGVTGVGNGIPVYASLEFCVFDDITVGPAASFDFINGNSALKVGAIGNYHWNKLIGIPSKFDFYAGLNAGFRFDFSKSKNSRFDLGAQVGGRWFWSEQWGLNAEFGFSGSVAGGFGVTYKL